MPGAKHAALYRNTGQVKQGRTGPSCGVGRNHLVSFQRLRDAPGPTAAGDMALVSHSDFLTNPFYRFVKFLLGKDGGASPVALQAGNETGGCRYDDSLAGFQLFVVQHTASYVIQRHP